MPNLCMNTLAIMGKKEDVETFVKFVTTKDNEIKIFNSLIPFPEELNDTVAPSQEENIDLINKYGADNWYDWKINNWGTKWGDYDHNITGEIQKSYNGEDWIMYYVYNTAWSPGENELAQAFAKQFPKLKAMLQYEEPGMCFAGETLISNGKIVRQDSWELNTLHETIDEVYWPQYEEESE